MVRLTARSIWTMALCAAITPVFAQTPAPPQTQGRAGGAPRVSMTLSSTAFADGARLPDKYSCVAEAAALRPPFAWANVPAAAVSLTLLMHDAEVHPGRGMYDNTHWIVWDLPSSSTGLTESTPMGVLPAGAVMGKNTSSMPPGFAREAAYAPPCAPPGNPHHYFFELFALDKALGLPATATRDDVMKAIDGHVVGKAVYTAIFSRPQPQQ
ncbi:MAG: YbhB/YbcL family Raf kinase inhibitor-like protein [Acidobacteria bacterium]|nr:YbhB/YbcL family Raf kinase inhibitor-like protein [Acidobacteriota bacterium]